ncbi:MAG: hypothetical protein HQL68_08945 [Magnetococcales bacterium]|nr:hypothetical protein [Magnetococcales bacterium]
MTIQSEPQLNEAYLKDAKPSIDRWMKYPEFQMAYEEEGMKIQIAEQIRSCRKTMKHTQA